MCTWIAICERSYAGAGLCRALCNSLQVKSLKRQCSLLLSWGAMAHIRRISAQLDERQVLDALRLAGMEAEIDPRGHKAMQPEQSHGRWQVNGIGFEVHPGYSSRWQCKEPDLVIVQGRTGWDAATLTRAACAIMQSCQGCWRSRWRLAHGRSNFEDVATSVRGPGSQQSRRCAAISQASAGSSRDWPLAPSAAAVAGRETHGFARSAACSAVARSLRSGRRLPRSHCTEVVEHEAGW